MKILDDWFSPNTLGVWYNGMNQKPFLNHKRFPEQLFEQFGRKKNETISTIHKTKEIYQTCGGIQVSTLINSFVRDDLLDEIIINGLSYRTSYEMTARQISDVIASHSHIQKKVEIVAQGKYLFPIGGDNYANNNYAHFVFEFLPKIVAALRLYGPSCCFVINSTCKKWAELINIVSQSIYDEVPNIIFIDRDKYSAYHCQNPIFIESSTAILRMYYQDFEQLRFINNLFVSKFRHGPCTKTYIARTQDNSTWRKLENFDQVRNIFVKKGYKVVIMKDLTQQQQLKILANSSHVAIEAGADSYASIFCPKGTIIYELIPENFVNGFGPVSTHLVLNQQYKRIIGQKTLTNIGKLPIDANYVISLDELLSILDVSE